MQRCRTTERGLRETYRATCRHSRGAPAPWLAGAACLLALCRVAQPATGAPSLRARGGASAAAVALTNPGFEDWPPSTGAPTGWRVTASAHGGSVSREENDVAAGKVSLKIAGGYCVIEQRQRVKTNTDYVLACRIKSGITTGKVMVKLEQNLGGKAFRAGELELGRWHGIGVPFNSVLEEDCRIIFLLRGKGALLVDAVSLRRVSPTGQSVTTKAKRLMDGLDYLSHQIDPSRRDKTWTSEFVTPLDGPLGPSSSGLPAWQPGQWVRYEARDHRLIPSSVSRKKKPELALIECSIVGTDGGRFWYQMTTQMKDYWVAKPVGESEKGECVLLGKDRRLVVKMLVDGPRFADVERYIVQIDDEQPIEYTHGRGAVLPACDLSDVLVRPHAVESNGTESIVVPRGEITCARGGDGDQLYVNGAIPVTGLAKAVLRSPYLDRVLEVVDWGEHGAQNRIAAEPRVLKLRMEPQLGMARVAWLSDVRFSPGYIIAKAEILHRAGFDFFAGFKRYVGDRRRFFNQRPSHFVPSGTWGIDLFDRWRSNLARSHVLLDEPYERQLNYEEVMDGAEIEGKTPRQIASLYVDRVAERVRNYRLWRGDTVVVYEGHEYIAWYDYRTGADMFVLENAGRARSWRERYPGLRKLSDEEILRWQYSFIKGTSEHFGKSWGMSVYRWLPDNMRLTALKTAYDMGASYLGFWQESEEAFPLCRILELAGQMREHMRTHAPTRAAPAKTAVVVPDGFVPQPTPNMWGREATDEGGRHQRIMQSLIAHTVPLIKQDTPFAIVVEDDSLNPGRYDKVIRLPHNTISDHMEIEVPASRHDALLVVD